MIMKWDMPATWTTLPVLYYQKLPHEWEPHLSNCYRILLGLYVERRGVKDAWGSASIENVIGNWWSHKILQTNSQISPISGSIKEQIVTFIGKEKIELYGKTYEVEHFKLTSKDMSIPKDKRLNFDIWFDKENALILKVAYSRMGNWEYRVKKFE